MMTERPARGVGSRPPVSVVVPFAGSPTAAAELLVALAALELRDGDELVVVDNSPAPAVEAAGPQAATRVVRAADERSSYHARNRGAEAAVNEWLLFTDADCRPDPALLDRYFERPVPDGTGVVGGRIEAGAGDGAVARWAAARENVNQARNVRDSRGAVATGNMLVRRAAWRDAGGFLEGIRSGGDLEFCWRVERAGWTLAYRHEAVVEHPPKRTLRGLAAQVARWSAGNAWQERRHPGASPRPPLLRSLARALGAGALFAATLRLERARLKLVDVAVALARAAGRLGSNAAPRRPVAGVEDAGARDHHQSPGAGAGSVVIVVDTFPAISETFIASEARALAAQGWRVRVEAGARPERPLLGGAREWRVDYLEDEGLLARAAALARLVARHPLRAVADLAGRRRWPDGERMPLRGLAPIAGRLDRFGDGHVHAHFAGPTATLALRAGRLTGTPVSIAAHGYDIYRSPTGLREKLEAASFVVATCDYTRRDLQAVLDPPANAKVQRIVMGVDGGRFRRRGPHSGGRTVVALGRYVEKKGFRHLLEAAPLIREREPEARIVIAGDGPLRAELEAGVRRLDLDGVVELPRADGAEAVRELLERAAVFAMPCVIAADGDRDSMPVVVKEALAMEVPVVASDEVGLPEVVRSRWGRLVPPGDERALAEAIVELLALPSRERAEMGRAGRAFVLEHCDVDSEAARLGELIRASASGSGSPAGRR